MLLVHCNFVSNKFFGQLLEISTKEIIISKTFDSEFSYIEIWFTNLNSKQTGIKGRIKIALVVNSCASYKKIPVIWLSQEIEYL